MTKRLMIILLLLAIALPCVGMHVMSPGSSYSAMTPKSILDYPHVGPIKSRIVQMGDLTAHYLLYLGAGHSGVIRNIFCIFDGTGPENWMHLKDCYLNIYTDAGNIANVDIPPAANLTASIPMASFLGAAYFDPSTSNYRYESKHHAIRIRGSSEGGFELNLPIPYSNGVLLQLWHYNAPIYGGYVTVTYEDGDLPSWQYKDWRLRSSAIIDDPQMFLPGVIPDGPATWTAADLTEFGANSQYFYGLATVQNPQHMQVVSDGAGDTGNLTVTGLDASGVTRAQAKALTGTTPVIFDTYLWKSITSVTVPAGDGSLFLGPSARVKAAETIRILNSAKAGYLVGLFASMRARKTVADWLYLENNWTFTPDGGTPMQYSGTEDLFGVGNSYYFTAGEEATPFHGMRYGATAIDTTAKWVDGAFRWFDDDGIQWSSSMTIDWPNTDGTPAAADAQVSVLYYGP